MCCVVRHESNGVKWICKNVQTAHGTFFFSFDAIREGEWKNEQNGTEQKKKKKTITNSFFITKVWSSRNRKQYENKIK